MCYNYNVVTPTHFTMTNKMTSYTSATDLREEYEDICDAMNRDRGEEVSEYSTEDEYRDERNGSERLADRHGC